MGQFQYRDERIKEIENWHKHHCLTDSDCTTGPGASYWNFVLDFEGYTCKKQGEFDKPMIDKGTTFFNKNECVRWCMTESTCAGFLLYTSGDQAGSCEIRVGCIKPTKENTLDEKTLKNPDPMK